ncbi:hypothetical protein LL06_08730 [Hoeflea sp. BAL378]|uniref:hypothetical protein n=1 Tax=Hoeflea sp. BAL378 TaxID=1547437 RepID=UPI0005146F44|nr:hypothetical protein [Hoeflea sp. BAL378]KGF69768.1 hypothetical protein LL06_08730 [Hoeflea sp. BAL378]
MKENSRNLLSRLMQDESIRSEALRIGGEMALHAVTRLAGATAGTRPVRLDSEVPAISPPQVEAALSYNMDPSSLNLSPEEYDWVVARSALVSIGSTKLLRLSSEERRRVLNHPDAATLVEKLLSDQEAEDERTIGPGGGDSVALTGAYMRELLRGNRIMDFATLSLRRLRAITAARGALDGVTLLSPSLPDAAEYQRRTDLAELLDPLGIIIGLDLDKSDDYNDRFVGRTAELRALRSFVDVLGSQSLSETLSRGFARSKSALTHQIFDRPPRLLTIAAPGGLGKSTLIAKFVYDHALSSQTRFPFAFLDFDRAALQPRSPGQMLVEIARQVSLQFPDSSKPLNVLRRDIRSSLSGNEGVPLRAYFETFQDLIRSVLESCRASTFLLTLDTMEIVQADPLAMNGVAAMVKALTERPFPELCIVAAGRSGLNELLDVNENNFRVERLQLQALSVGEAQTMVDRLGKNLMGAEWNSAWASKIAGSRSHSEIRREPLTLRLAVEIVRETVPSKRKALIDDIHRLGENADDGFVGALYERRILDHIRNPHARKLAWPGLVARTVDMKLVRNVLAGICGLSDEEAGEAFETLSLEGWIVEASNGALRHRRDLRARTLPMMRRHDPKRFHQVLDALIDYHSNPKVSDPLEEVYYRLLRGSPEDVRSVTGASSLIDSLAAARGDMEEGSPGWCVLEAHFADRPMALEHMRKLPADLLWEHVARTGSSLRGMDDRQIEPRVQLLMGIDPFETAGLPPSKAAMTAWQHLQIKCGRWDRLEEQDLLMPIEQCDVTSFAFYASRLSLANVESAKFWGERYPSLLARIFETRGRKNWQALAQALVVARLYDRELAEDIDRQIVENYASRATFSRSSEFAMRTILIHGLTSSRSVIQNWCALEASRILEGISVAEFCVVAPIFAERGWLQKEGNIIELLVLARELAFSIEQGNIPPIARRIISDKLALSLLVRAFERCASEMDEDPEIKQAFGLYCTLRQPEWIVPFGYLFADGIHSEWCDVASQQVKEGHYSHEPSSWWPLSSSRRKPSLQNDVIKYLTWADRACDLDGALSMLLRFSPAGESKNFEGLEMVRRQVRENHFHNAVTST